jgi:hypothetical protein
MNTPLENNPIRHIQRIKAQMSLIINQLREDVENITEARARMLFKKSVEVLAGVVQACDDYEKTSRTALQHKLVESLPKIRSSHGSRR